MQVAWFAEIANSVGRQLDRYSHGTTACMGRRRSAIEGGVRAPSLEQQLGDHGAKLIAGIDPPPVVTCSPRSGTPMGIEWAVAAAGDGVAPKLPRDRRRRASESFGDRPQAQPGLVQIGHFDALVLG